VQVVGVINLLQFVFRPSTFTKVILSKWWVNQRYLANALSKHPDFTGGL